MERIHVLSPQVAGLIAAGEVVDRPASVIKELLENSIDAGATRVSVEIEGGGIRLMRVADNGCGMSAKDAVLCFERHVTSKVRAAEDLAGVSTLGSRGEALPSIAAVARVTMRTREAESEEGVEIVIEGGALLSSKPCGCPVGTEITVTDLFFNTPARKKFLKKESTESSAIGSLLEKLALSRPELALVFRKDGRIGLRTSGQGELRKTASDVLGEGLARELLPLDLSHGGVRVHGLCGTPESARPNRQAQIFFVAGRYVRSRVLQTALEEAYRGSLPNGRYPVCVLFLDLSPTRVDANVHPQKMEVKFADERMIYDAVLHTVSQALSQRRSPPVVRTAESNPAASPSASGKSLSSLSAAHAALFSGNAQVFSPSSSSGGLSLAQNISLAPPRRRGSIDVEASDWQYYGKHAAALRNNRENALLPPPYGKKSGNFSSAADASPQIKAEPVTDAASADLLPRDLPLLDGNASQSSAEERSPLPEAQQSGKPQETEEQVSLPLQSFRLVGELFRTYLVAEFEEELWLVDKHAARERILYEQFRTENRVEPQLLLTPLVIEPGRIFTSVVEEYADTLSEAGFSAELFGEQSVLLRTVPMNVEIERSETLFLELLELLRNGKKHALSELFDEVLHRVACAAAVKAGSKEPSIAGEALVKELLRLPNVRYCPHGRPCIKVVPKKYLEKEFLRG
jgi:DNA mismatch repair protein MutL